MLSFPPSQNAVSHVNTHLLHLTYMTYCSSSGEHCRAGGMRGLSLTIKTPRAGTLGVLDVAAGVRLKATCLRILPPTPVCLPAPELCSFLPGHPAYLPPRTPGFATLDDRSMDDLYSPQGVSKNTVCPGQTTR